MLDRDPNPPRPPDNRSSRHRSSKQKNNTNAPKKQPQRGLGVAQLEKLRLEEQSKQGAAAAAAATLFGYGNLGEQKRQLLQLHHLHQHNPHVVHQQQQHFHHHQQQQSHHQNANQTSPSVRQIQLTEPSESALAALTAGFSEHHHQQAKLSIPCPKLSIPQHSFVPLAISRHSLAMPLVFPQHQTQLQQNQQKLALALEGSSTVAASHSFSVASPALLAITSPVSAPETPWLKKHSISCELLMQKNQQDRDPSLRLLPLDKHSKDEREREPEFCAIASGKSGSMSEFSPHSSGKPPHRDDGVALLTDLSLQQQQHQGAGDGDGIAPSASNQLEAPFASIAPIGLQMRELSSFQTTSLCSTWPPAADQVSNRKRPWTCVQEASCHMESFKGVDLNASVDEIQSESMEQDNTSASVPSTTRDSWSFSPLLSPCLVQTESSSKMLPTDSACSECGSKKSDKCRSPCILRVNVSSGSPTNGAGNPSLRRNNIDYDFRDVETLREFLTLGPSNHRVRESGKSMSDSVILKINEKGNGFETLFSSVASIANIDSSREELEANCCSTPLQTKGELAQKLAWNKTDGPYCYSEQSRADGHLDLELRLSI